MRVSKRAKKEEGFFSRIVNWLSPAEEAVSAVHLFEGCVAHAKTSEFYTKGQVSSDFMGNISIIALHVWMVHTRIKSDAYEAKPYVHHIYEQLWVHVEERLLAEGISPWLLSKNLNEVQKVVIGSLMTYDVTFQTFQKTEDSRPFLGALWRNIYAGDLDINRANLVQMRDYVWSQLDTVMFTDEDDFYSGKVAWRSYPTTPATPCEESESLDSSYAHDIMFSEEDKFNTWR